MSARVLYCARATPRAGLGLVSPSRALLGCGWAVSRCVAVWLEGDHSTALTIEQTTHCISPPLPSPCLRSSIRSPPPPSLSQPCGFIGESTPHSRVVCRETSGERVATITGPCLAPTVQYSSLSWASPWPANQSRSRSLNIVRGWPLSTGTTQADTSTGGVFLPRRCSPDSLLLDCCAPRTRRVNTEIS